MGSVIVTAGDPLGVGPEVLVKAIKRLGLPVTVIGSIRSLKKACESCGLDMDFTPVDEPTPLRDSVPVIDIDDFGVEGSGPTPEGGLHSYLCIRKASELILGGKAEALVTGPVSKEAVNMAGIKFTGHTELLAELAGGRKTKMMLFLDELRVSHVTTHVALKDVPRLLKEEEIILTVELTSSFLGKLGEPGKIGVSSLNPHAGEGGLFGDEEIRIIRPAIEKLIDRGYEVEGPIPADTIFLRAMRGEFKAVVAMYHDQGHIPIKLLGFNRAVNVTLGLPYVRTSVDHGTAYDIAGKCLADEGSMVNAIKLAFRLLGC